MPTLEYWPQQQHHELIASGQTIKAGGTFEASEEDVEELLANPEIRKPEGVASDAVSATQDEPPADEPTESNAPQWAQSRQQDQPQQPSQSQSPGRAERSSTT